MPIFRVIFLAFMTWLLVLFLPGHKRGAITLGPRDEGDSCCAPQPAPVPPTCCESTNEPASKSDEPTSKDKANCAVCFWAAGLLNNPIFVFDMSHAERAFEHARLYYAQVRLVACLLNQYGRDPPARLPDSIVV